MKFQHQKIFNSKGSALMMVLFLTVGIAGISLAFIQRAKSQALISARQEVDSDLDKIMSQIGGLVMTPASCNANFKGRATPSTGAGLTAIQTCSATNCELGTGTNTFFNSSALVSWTSTADYATTLSNSNNVSSKIRIVGLTYSVDTPMTGIYSPAFLTLLVTFQIKLSPTTAVRTLPPRQLRFNIVASDSSMTPTITGCPRDPGISAIY